MRFLALFIIGFVAPTLLAQPLVIREWFRTFDGGGRWHDHAAGVVLSTDGSVILAGERGFVNSPGSNQVCVFKFSAEGQLAWFRPSTWNDGWDSVFAGLAVDDDGNAFVAGQMLTGQAPHSVAAYWARYDGGTGTQMWASIYRDPPGYRPAMARYIDIASNGDPLVSGQVTLTNDPRSLAAMRVHNSDGSLRWVSTYYPYFNSQTDGRSIGDLPNGEVFTANQHSIGVGVQDGLAIWHDGQTGEIRRLYLYDSGCRDGFQTRLATDSQGYAYTSGGGCYEENGQVYNSPMVWKWSPTGDLAWYRGIRFRDSGSDGGIAGIILDHDENLLVLRDLERSPGQWVSVLIKLDKQSGQTIWVSYLPNSDYLNLTKDQIGDIYIAGIDFHAPVGSTPQDGQLTKVRNSDGQILWRESFHHGSVHGGADRFYDVAVDRHGNVYACGSASVTNNLADFLLVKYRQPIRGDVNLDGCVDDQDLALQLEAFGTFDDRYDSNGDGFVNMADVLLLLDHFGQGCE